MKRCKEPGCKTIATEEWQGMPLCEEHYYYIRNRFKSEWEILLER